MPLPVIKLSKRLLARVARLRQDLHKHPELGFEEHRTAAVIAARLRDLGMDEVRTGVAGTGVIGLLRGAHPGPTVGLRADMDALPILEETGLPYASACPGVMHACGHDGHVAVALGVADLLSGMRERLAGNVKFIFQPAEEGGAGGERMVAEGCLRDPDVDVIFALHARAGVSVGQIELSPTPNVGVDSFELTVQGKGAHGALPHLSVDPVAIGAQIIVAAQTIVSREMRPDRPVVLSFCCFQAGTKHNIIPDTARILGTIRALDLPTLRRVRRAVERVARGVAGAMRGKVTFADEPIYPPVYNDPDLLDLVREVGGELLGRRNVIEASEQRMGAEDFAFYLADNGGVPGVIFSLGVATEANLHTSRFDFGSEALEPGILMMANVALRALERQ